jgi:hypothetical protein
LLPANQALAVMALQYAAFGSLLSREDKDAGQELIDLLKDPFVSDKVGLIRGLPMYVANR